MTGKEVPAPEPGGQDERDGAQRGGKVQALCLQSGGEEPGPHPQVGGEVSRVYWQLPGAIWTRWSLGMLTLTLIHKIHSHIPLISYLHSHCLHYFDAFGLFFDDNLLKGYPVKLFEVFICEPLLWKGLEMDEDYYTEHLIQIDVIIYIFLCLLP